MRPKEEDADRPLLQVQNELRKSKADGLDVDMKQEAGSLLKKYFIGSSSHMTKVHTQSTTKSHLVY